MNGRRPAALRIGLLLLLAAALVAGGVASLRKETSELPVYVTGAARMLEREPIYRIGEPKPFTYPPAFALPFVPLVPLGASLQRLVWYAVNLAVLALVLRELDRWFRPLLAPAQRIWFWIITLGLAGRHLLSVFENQSHDLLVLLCVTFAAVEFATGRELRAGAWAGLGAAWKATPLLFLVPFVLQRRWRAVFVLGGATVLVTALPDLLLPQADGRSWARSWFDTMLSGLRPGATAALTGTWSAASYLNQSLSGTLHRLTTPVVENGPFLVDAAVVALDPGARRIVILGGQLLVVAAVAWAAVAGRGRHAGAASRRFAVASAVACGMVLLSPMSSKAHFGVLLLPIALLVRAWLTDRRDPVLVVLLLLLALAGPLTVKGLVGREIGELALAYGSVTFCALVALAGSLREAVRGAAADTFAPP